MTNKLEMNEIESIFYPKMLQIFSSTSPINNIEFDPFNKNIESKQIIYSSYPFFSLKNTPNINEIFEISKKIGDRGIYIGNCFDDFFMNYHFILFSELDVFNKKYVLNQHVIISENCHWGLLIFNSHIGVVGFKNENDFKNIKNDKQQVKEFLEDTIYYKNNFPYDMVYTSSIAKNFLTYLYSKEQAKFFFEEYNLY